MNVHSIPWPKIGAIMQASVTLLIAVIAALIQRQQALTNRRQHRLALFEKRMKVYDGTVNFITDIVTDPDKLEVPRLFTFWQDVSQQAFLFGPDIKEYLDELFKKGNELRARIATRNTLATYDRETELLNWFDQQRKVATETFLPYLDLRKP